MQKIDLDKIDFTDKTNPQLINIGISNRHLHVTTEDLYALFGEGYELTVKVPVTQPGQYAANETVTIVGPKGVMEGVRILGPVRPETQLEISQTDARLSGIAAPLRQSGDLKGSGNFVVIGPKGTIIAKEAAIVPNTHLHLNLQQGAELNIQDKEMVDIYFKNAQKSGVIFDVLARVNKIYEKDLHINTDEANAFQLKNGELALIVKKQQ